MQLVVLVVMVVVTVYTVGAASGALAQGMAAFGMSVMTQAANNATGLQQGGVDWNSAARAGVTAGVMSAATGSTATEQGQQLENLEEAHAAAVAAGNAAEAQQLAEQISQLRGVMVLHSAANAAASYTLNYGLGKAMGDDVSFSLRDLASSTFTSGILAGMGSGNVLQGDYIRGEAEFTWSGALSAAFTATAKTAIDYVANQVFHDGEDFDADMAFANNFGNEIGNAWLRHDKWKETYGNMDDIGRSIYDSKREQGASHQEAMAAISDPFMREMHKPFRLSDYGDVTAGEWMDDMRIMPASYSGDDESFSIPDAPDSFLIDGLMERDPTFRDQYELAAMYEDQALRKIRLGSLSVATAVANDGLIAYGSAKRINSAAKHLAGLTSSAEWLMGELETTAKIVFKGAVAQGSGFEGSGGVRDQAYALAGELIRTGMEDLQRIRLKQQELVGHSFSRLDNNALSGQVTANTPSLESLMTQIDMARGVSESMIANTIAAKHLSELAWSNFNDDYYSSLDQGVIGQAQADIYGQEFGFAALTPAFNAAYFDMQEQLRTYSTAFQENPISAQQATTMLDQLGHANTAIQSIYVQQIMPLEEQLAHYTWSPFSRSLGQ